MSETDPTLDADLDALFEKARAFPPSEAQLARMLRGVRGERPASTRRLARMAGAFLLAAAAVIAAVVIVLPPNQPRAFAMSDMPAAMRKVRVVKYVHADGECGWSGDQIYASTRDEGRSILFWNIGACERTTYDQERGSIILSSADPWTWPEPDMHYYTLESLVQSAESFGRSFDEEWQREDVKVDGRPMIIVTARNPRNYAYRKYGIDPATGLFAWGEFGAERIAYEYPDHPPRDIYEVGAPRDAPILDWRATADILALRDRVMEARKLSYGAYRMVRVRSDAARGGYHRTGSVEYVLTDAERYRMDLIPLAEQRELDVEELPDIARQCLSRDPCDLSQTARVCDGRTETRVSAYENDRPVRLGIPSKAVADAWMITLEGAAWFTSADGFFGSFYDQRFELPGHGDNSLPGFRSFQQADDFERPKIWERRFDPDHGYSTAYYGFFSFPDPDWQLDPRWREDYVSRRPSFMLKVLPDAPPLGWDRTVLEYAELRPGQWYPRLVRYRQLALGDDGPTWQPTEDSFPGGYVSNGRIVCQQLRKASASPRPPVTYEYVLAEPLDSVDDAWFQLPPEWIGLPTEPRP